MTDARRAVPSAVGTATDLGVDSDDRSAAAASAAAGLWVETLQALADYIAHDLRNALNAVAVNLEVVRGRSARGAEASAIAPFAATAASQFEVASGATEALLAFARPEPGDPDVAGITHRLGRLVGLRSGSRVTVTDRTDGNARTSAPGDVVRAVVARSVLNALGTTDTIGCETTAAGDIFLRVTGASPVLPIPEPELVAVAAGYGVRFASQGNVLELRFPSAGARATPPVSA